MTERYHRSSVVSDSYMNPTKMENDFTPKKTMIIMVIVVACFAVLWPKIFYPMLVGSANQQIKPSAIDKTTGCCYVLSETDVDTIKIMSELCGEIIRQQVGVTAPLTGRQIINICQDEVYRTCGIDVSMVLQEQVRLGHTTKQILDEIRSLNGSLCLKYNFGVQPWRLGVPHMVTLRNVSDSVRQERSPLVRSEMIHPAFRERGRAIPQAKPTRPHPKIIDGTPGPLPGMRPTMGGPGHMVPPSKQQGSGSMGIIMPIYTIGIVIFFTYTLMKIICKKHPETDTIYSKMDLDPRFRKEMLTENGSRGSRDAGSCKLGWKERDTIVNAMSALLEEVDQEIEARRGSSEVAQEECLNSANLSNGSVKKDEKPSVKIMAMETSESCEDGKKWQSANSSVLPSVPQPVIEKVDPPKEIYLDRTLPAQSQILVADSATETEKNASNDDTAVVLAGKMTLSLISLENEELEVGDILNVQSNETKEAIEDNKPILEEEINHIIEEAIECIDSSSAKTEIVPKQEVEMASYKTVANDINIVEKDEPEELILEIIEKETEETKKEEKSVPKKEQEVKIESGENVDSLESKRTEAAPDLVEKHRTTSEVPSSRTGKPLLNTNAKSSSEDSGSSILSGSNQGSVINVRTRSFEDDDKEEEEEEISEEESDVEYEEEEIEVSEEEENGGLEVQRERHSIQPGEIQNQNGGAELLNGVLTHNADPEGEESEEEEVIEEIIEEYSDDEENLELNSN